MNRPMNPDETTRQALIALIPRLRRFARSLASDSAAADDLVQATLERALTRGTDVRDPAALQAWLFSVLYRAFVDEHRRAARWKRIARLFWAAYRRQDPAIDWRMGTVNGEPAILRFAGDQLHSVTMITVDGMSDMSGLKKRVYSVEEIEAAHYYLASDGMLQAAYFTSALQRYRQASPDSALSDLAVATLISSQ